VIDWVLATLGNNKPPPPPIASVRAGFAVTNHEVFAGVEMTELEAFIVVLGIATKRKPAVALEEKENATFVATLPRVPLLNNCPVKPVTLPV
jgi:hypothetical protein